MSGSRPFATHWLLRALWRGPPRNFDGARVFFIWLCRGLRFAETARGSLASCCGGGSRDPTIGLAAAASPISKPRGPDTTDSRDSRVFICAAAFELLRRPPRRGTLAHFAAARFTRSLLGRGTLPSSGTRGFGISVGPRVPYFACAQPRPKLTGRGVSPICSGATDRGAGRPNGLGFSGGAPPPLRNSTRPTTPQYGTDATAPSAANLC